MGGFKYFALNTLTKHLFVDIVNFLKLSARDFTFDTRLRKFFPRESKFF